MICTLALLGAGMTLHEFYFVDSLPHSREMIAWSLFQPLLQTLGLLCAYLQYCPDLGG